MTSPSFLLRAVLLLGLTVTGSAAAGDLHVAVASNFAGTMEALAHRFEASTGHRVLISTGSTGKHYAQIRKGAPFDLFFAADAKRPRLLEEEGLTVKGSRFTYARGRVVLWSPREGYVDPKGRVLQNGGFEHLAVANPRLAPYGAAAMQVLEGLGLSESLQRHLVRGENIGQTYQFVATGAAELGFVALSQVRRPGEPTAGSLWEVPSSLYAPIEQQAVLLRRGADNPGADAFLTFVRGPEGVTIIEAYGYGVPGG